MNNNNNNSVSQVEEQVNLDTNQELSTQQQNNVVDHSAEAYMRIWDDEQYVAEIQSKKSLDRGFAEFMTKLQAGHF